MRYFELGQCRWHALDDQRAVISAVLFERFSSRGIADYADCLLTAIRQQFDGHDEKNA